MSYAMSRYPQTGQAPVDFSKINASMDLARSIPQIIIAMLADRPALASTSLRRVADEVLALSPDSAEIADRLRASAEAAAAPVDPNVDGLMMYALSERICELRAEMAAFHAEISGIVGSEEILSGLAADISAVAHPDTPFITAEDHGFSPG